jgi:hypothetical protein
MASTTNVDPVADPVGKGERSQARQFVGALVIVAATAQALGVALKAPTHLEVNDISRWCTVWSLLERGTYAIDDCPWSEKTQDKVLRADKLAVPGPEAGAVKRLEYAIAPRAWKEGEPTERFYSSKPPLLPTLIAGVLYPFRAATGVKLDELVIQERLPRWVEKRIEGQPGKTERVLETPEKPALWPVHIFYLKPIVVLLNVVPMLLTLVLFARLLDRHAANDWAWFFSLFAAAWGTYLFAFDQTLNNHTVAAWSAFLAIYALVRIVDDGRESPGYYAMAGFFGGFTACNEIPAALFGLLLFVVLLVHSPRRTLLAFVPAAAVPIGAFLVTQFLAFGQFMPVYEEFGTRSYEYEGSYWTTPLEMDWYNKNPEPVAVYLFHMTLGHHGVFSLTPVFLFSLWGALRLVGGRRRLSAVAWLTILLTIAMLAFYAWNPKARNYGGSTQGLRWLFWLIPFWLVTLPAGVEGGQVRKGWRGLALAALAVSVLSVGYALRHPWSHPWILDLMEHLDILTLKR